MPIDLITRDVAACRKVLRTGSKSFATASTLLPSRMRDPATVLYAFCRVADDAVDATPNATAATVDLLRARLDRAYAGRPDNNPIDRSLATVVAGCHLPRVLLEALLDGMLWDAEGRRYETMSELQDYAARVAGTVGVMMAVVMGRRSADVLARACDLGVAMQLTNIARDVGEDARSGRIYLPLEWLRAADIDPARWLESPTPGDALASVVARLLAAADELYQRADTGIARLPRDCRFAIRAARFIYADIGRAIARARFDSVTRRAFVTRWRKLWLLARALRGQGHGGQAFLAPPLECSRFLVDACAEGG